VALRKRYAAGQSARPREIVFLFAFVTHLFRAAARSRAGPG
jgi:hypothetical protein